MLHTPDCNTSAHRGSAKHLILHNKMSWLGREGSNLRMSVPKTDALPLGDAPTAAVISEATRGVQGGFRENLHVVVTRGSGGV
ncbi:MAG: hypothetical protein JWS10_2164 [Cypionkella sp.]|nr:hypothetical protein [Cypionkella sp.]